MAGWSSIRSLSCWCARDLGVELEVVRQLGEHPVEGGPGPVVGVVADVADPPHHLEVDSRRHPLVDAVGRPPRGRSPITSCTVRGFSSSQSCSSESARSTRPWCRSSRSASASSPPSSGEIGSSRTAAPARPSRGSRCARRAPCSARSPPPRPPRRPPAARCPRRRATRHPPRDRGRRHPLADDVLLQEVLADEVLEPAAQLVLAAGISAVCGIGSPSGCLNRAVTANQSAMAPTIDASAPALTNPRNPCWSNVSR